MDINIFKEIILILVKVNKLRMQRYTIRREQLASGLIPFLAPFKYLKFGDLHSVYTLNHARSLLEFHSR